MLIAQQMHGSSLGYSTLFALIAAESLGIPLPGETALITAAALAAQGHLSLPLVIMTAISAAILGDNGGYWIGRRGGTALIARYGHALHVRPDHLARARAFFERHGPKTVFLGRFVAVLRTWVAVLAGASGMRYGLFMAYNAIGGVVWSLTFAGLGYAFGANLPRLTHSVGRASLVLALLVALAVVVVLALRWMAANRDAVTAAAQRAWQRTIAWPTIARVIARYPRAYTFLTGRFARSEALGLHLTLGFLVSFGGMLAFSAITEDVLEREGLVRFDVQLLQWLESQATPLGYSIFQAITQVGSPLVMAVLGVVVALALALKRQWIALTGWIAAFAGAGLLNLGLKLVIQRPRPMGAERLVSSESWSYPSGHAMGSLIGYGMLAYLVCVYLVKRRSRQVVVWGAAALLALAIGVSRLYLGVHYFSDVVAGYAAGLLWLAACVSGVEVGRRWGGADAAVEPLKSTSLL